MDFLVLSFVVVVVGGMGSLEGAVAAGFLLGILQSFASMNEVKSILPGIDQIIIYLVAVVILLVRPRGLMGREVTGYLSFGHAAFLGVGSYTAVWSFKLLTMNVIPAVILGTLVSGLFAWLIGWLSLRRSGIYFSILTLAFAQMAYAMAYSVLTPITNGETGLQLTQQDPRWLDRMAGILPTEGLPSTNLFGLEMKGYSGFYFCAVLLIIGFWITLKIFRSPYGLKLTAIKSNQMRMKYTGFNTRPYLLSA